MELKLKRAYDPAEPSDGFRILVDGLWPRGVSKVRADLDLWDKEVAPSAELRKAFHHEGMSWDDFEAKYRAELAGSPALEELKQEVAKHPVVTLLYGSHDKAHNNAVLLKELLTSG